MAYLDFDGLSTYDGLIKAEINGKIDIGGRAGKIPFGRCDSTSTATVFTATVDGLTELTDGTCVMLENGVVTSASGWTLNVNGLGAKPVYTNLAAATRDTTIFNINYTMLFVYDSQRVSGGAWVCYRGYDANTDTIGYQLRTHNTVRNVSDTARYYKIYFTSADGMMWVPASVNSTNNATSARPVNQRPIDPFGPIVYTSAATNYAAGADLAARTIWEQYSLTLGYSFNRTGAALALTSERPVYVKCAPQANGSAIMDADEPIVQALPTSKDGKIYIYLGLATSATACELQIWHPVYWHDGTGIRIWTGSEGASLAGITLNTSAEPYDVPVSNSTAVIGIGDGLKVDDSYGAELSVKFGTTAKTVAAGNHTHSGYQPTLVSGTSIKTINGESILGSGNIATPTYTLPEATTSTLGGVKVDGTTITATDGVISAVGGGGGVSYATQAIRIPASAWRGTTATVNASAATATNDVIVAPAPESVSAWASAGIYCSAQGSGTLTFACTTAPTVAVTANVMAFEGGETIAPSTYSVTVSLTNPSYGHYFKRCDIYGYDTTAGETTVLLGEIDSPTGSATVEYDPSLHEKLSLHFDTNWGTSYTASNITCTGGVSFYNFNSMNDAIFNVEGDGTITIDGIDYDD